MSSTNKTTNYDLSQYIGSDKPTYLSDYNGDMFKIDAQMKANADNVATAIQGATDASSLASTANSTATTANNNANTAIANNASTQAMLNTFMQKFNLDTHLSYTLSDVTYNTGSVTFASGATLEINIARNSDGSIFKVYGQIIGTPNSTGSLQIILPNTGILTDETYGIYPCGMHSWVGQNPDRVCWLAVENNRIILYAYIENISANKIYYMPCLYFNGNFGDNPNQ